VEELQDTVIDLEDLSSGVSIADLTRWPCHEALARGADRASIKRQTGHQREAMLDR
jgi:hypothetical protein